MTLEEVADFLHVHTSTVIGFYDAQTIINQQRHGSASSRD
jgi:hypothetical protein